MHTEILYHKGLEVPQVNHLQEVLQVDPIHILDPGQIHLKPMQLWPRQGE